MEIAITKLSSKGQIVLPLEMRKKFNVGEKLLIIEDKNRFILKRASKLDSEFNDDLKFAKRSDEALDKIKAGKFKTMNSNNFLDELAKW